MHLFTAKYTKSTIDEAIAQIQMFI